MRILLKGLKKFLRNEDGLETVEYGVVAALVILGMIVAVTEWGRKVSVTFTTLSGKLP